MALFAGSTYDVITKYLPDAVDKYMVNESKSLILENGSKFIDVNFNEAGYVKIASMLMDGLSNYYKTQVEPRPDNPNGFAAYAGNIEAGDRDGFDIGGADVKWEIFKLQWCRGRQFRIDHIANEETGKILTGGLIEEFHRLHVIPEIDACRFSVIADAASATLGNLVVETVGAADTYDVNESNILRKFFTMRKWLVDNGCPLEDLVWFVSTDVYPIIVNSKELTRYITQEDYRSDAGLEFKVTKFNGVPIIEVEPSRFYTDIEVTRNGYKPTATSKSINYMMCSKKGIVPIRKIEYSKVYGEDLTGIAGFYGTMMNYLLYHGIVIPRNKRIATFVSVKGGENVKVNSNVLLVDLRATGEAGQTQLRGFYTQPVGLRGTVVFSATEIELGSTVSGIDEANGPISWKLDAVKTLADNKGYFALVDYRGVAVAVSKLIENIPGATAAATETVGE